MADVERQLPGIGDRQNQGIIISAEARVMGLLEPLQMRESETIPPEIIGDTLLTYQDQVIYDFAKARGQENNLLDAVTIQTPEEQAIIATIQHVRAAFNIVAYPYYPSDWQQVLSEDVHESSNHGKPQERFTLTDEEKGILQQLTTLAGIPDNPDQRTYTYASIPHIVESE